jgi:chromosome segregation ATPase
MHTLEQRGDNMTNQIEEVSNEFKKHASAFNLASIMSQMTTEIKNRLKEHFKNESSAEEMIKPLEEQVSELKLTIAEHQTAIMNLTSTDDNLEKKIRGL